MKQKNHKLMTQTCAAIAASILFFSHASADDAVAQPAVQRAGDVTYVSGGVGLDESNEMKAQAGKYSLSVLFTAHMGGKRDVYTSPAHVTITKADNSAVLDFEPNGPYLLVNLPSGKYKITASDGQHSRTQAVDIAAGARKRLVFTWREDETTPK